MITLQITPPIGLAHEEQLDRDQVRIGRSPENDVAIQDPSVSRLHASIERTRDGFMIQDLGSRNGVMVNGRRIGGPTLITEQDEVQLGDVILKLRTGRTSRSPTRRSGTRSTPPPSSPTSRTRAPPS